MAKIDQRRQALYALAVDYVSGLRRGIPNSVNVAALADVIDDAATGWIEANRENLTRAAKAAQRRVVIAGHFGAEVQTQLKVIAAEEHTTVQQLLAEGLNAVFTRRGKPDCPSFRNES
jgi:hypothetical protein